MDAIDRHGVDQWHLARNGRQCGPYSFSTLTNAVREGVLSRDDQIWRSGWQSWRAAQDVPGLFAPPELCIIPHAAPKAPSGDLVAAVPIKSESAADITNHHADQWHPLGKRKQAVSKGNYLLRHWRGELSLPVSYWLNGFLVFLAAYIAGFLIASILEWSQLQAGAPVALALICFFAVIVVLSVWQMVGIWRSASRHAAKGKKFWAGVAKVLVIIGAARSAIDLGNTSFPLVSEHIKIALGDEGMGQHRFRLLRNGTELEFSGGIKVGTAKDFERILDAASQVRVLHLNSFGGRITEADLIAEEVRKRALITYISEHCESACTHIFLAGRERWISERGTLGFHRPSFPGLDREALATMIQEERRTLLSFSLPTYFVERALNTPSLDFHGTRLA